MIFCTLPPLLVHSCIQLITAFKKMIVHFLGPSAYPADLKVESTTPPFLNFSWRSLSSNEENGIITGYQYCLYTSHNQRIGRVTHLRNKITIRPTVWPYAISVAAVNANGAGTHSPLVIVPRAFDGKKYYQSSWFLLFENVYQSMRWLSPVSYF